MRSRPWLEGIAAAVAVLLIVTLVWVRSASGPDSASTDGQGQQSARTDESIDRGELGDVREGDQRPNVVVVMADDMRVDELRFAPHVRRLIGGKGVEFRNSFSPYPLCCPARASFMTGRYAHNHEVFSHLEPYGFGSFDDSFTLATALRSSGYNTGFIGKYLNGYGIQPSRVEPDRRWDYVPRGWTDWYGAVEDAPGSPAEGGTYNYFATAYNINGRIDNSHVGEYQTNTLGRMSRSLVTKYSQADRPFFLYVNSVAPHHGAPREPGDPNGIRDANGNVVDFVTPARPDRVKGKFDDLVTKPPGLPVGGGPAEDDMADKSSPLRVPDLNAAERRAEIEVARQRGESISVLDQEVKRLIATLRSTGELDDTVIMFTSDNGYFLGEHRLRAGKIRSYEPSLRVPLLMRGPGIPRGQDVYDPVTTMDVTASIADLGGAEGKWRGHFPRDGHSVVAAARGERAGWTMPVVAEGMLTRPADPTKNPDRGFDDARDIIGIRTARYKLIKLSGGWTELYDLNSDPNELESVSQDPEYADVRRLMLRAWKQYKDCLGAECRAELPPELQADAATTRQWTTSQLRQISERTGVRW